MAIDLPCVVVPSNLRGAKGRRDGEHSPPDRRSGAEPTVPAGIRPQGTEEVDVAEVGPVGLAEVELRRCALPEEEAAEPLLPRRADDEVGIGLALGVEVPGDVVCRQRIGYLLDALTGGRPLEQQ